MIITVTIEQYAVSNNGTTVTAKRFVKKLREKGHTVRVITASPCDEEDVYVVPSFNFPIVSKIIRSQGMELAKKDEECYRIIGQAVFGADILHCFLPFGTSHIAVHFAKMYGIPYMGAFHVQPENITYTLHLNRMRAINNFLYRYYKKFFDMLPHVHCPSDMIKNMLLSFGYQSELHVISNGIDDFFRPVPAVRPAGLEDKYIVVMSGRYSREKRQDLLIKAVAKSKYKDKIHLVLCGRGPWTNKLHRLAKKHLAGNVMFGFKSQADLRELYNYADLYVHASDIEIEAISCMEAFACGLVPVISNNPLVATKAFARTEKSLFEAGDHLSLRDRIDYFIEHPEEKEELSHIYAEYAKQFVLEDCVQRLEDVFDRCIQEHKERKTVR